MLRELKITDAVPNQKMGVNFFLSEKGQTEGGGGGGVFRTHIFPSLFSWIIPLETLDPGTRDTIWICQKPSDVYRNL